jgi:hypothetical protein
LDRKGPADRLFTPFREQDLERQIIEHFKRAGTHATMLDADTAASLTRCLPAANPVPTPKLTRVHT